MPGARSSRSTSRTARSGTARRSPRVTRWCESACAATDPGTTSCSLRSTPCTPTPRPPPTPTGAQVLALYDQLYAATPTPVVALNRAVALGGGGGPGSRPRRRRRPRPRRLPPVPRDPRRPAAPAGPVPGGGGRLRPGDRRSPATRPSRHCSPPGATPSAEPRAVDEHERDEAEHPAVAVEPGVAVVGRRGERLLPVGRVAPRRPAPSRRATRSTTTRTRPTPRGCSRARAPPRSRARRASGHEPGQVGELLGRGLEGRRGPPRSVGCPRCRRRRAPVRRARGDDARHPGSRPGRRRRG